MIDKSDSVCVCIYIHLKINIKFIFFAYTHTHIKLCFYKKMFKAHFKFTSIYPLLDYKIKLYILPQKREHICNIFTYAIFKTRY